MNGVELKGRSLYVGRAQKRLERQGELKRKFELIKQDRIQRYQVRCQIPETPPSPPKRGGAACCLLPPGCESVREEPG